MDEAHNGEKRQHDGGNIEDAFAGLMHEVVPGERAEIGCAVPGGKPTAADHRQIPKFGSEFLKSGSPSRAPQVSLPSRPLPRPNSPGRLKRGPQPTWRRRPSGTRHIPPASRHFAATHRGGDGGAPP